ncbi:hypothetical protein DMENIID0001_155680 [Sergentomyia squamirostris]
MCCLTRMSFAIDYTLRQDSSKGIHSKFKAIPKVKSHSVDGSVTTKKKISSFLHIFLLSHSSSFLKTSNGE